MLFSVLYFGCKRAKEPINNTTNSFKTLKVSSWIFKSMQNKNQVASVGQLKQDWCGHDFGSC